MSPLVVNRLLNLYNRDYIIPKDGSSDQCEKINYRIGAFDKKSYVSVELSIYVRPYKLICS